MPFESKTEETILAQIMLKRPGSWSQECRDEIAKWLRRHADELMLHGETYNDTGNFIARHFA